MYIAEPSGGEIFLMRKFNTRIIFTAKISQSTVHCIYMYSVASCPDEIYTALSSLQFTNTVATPFQCFVPLAPGSLEQG